MNLDKELIRELKLREVPINLILDATCKSPPGIKHEADSKGRDCDLGKDSMEPTKRVLTESELPVESCAFRDRRGFGTDRGDGSSERNRRVMLENISEMSDLGKGGEPADLSLYSRIKKSTSYDPTSRTRKNVPRLHLPIKRRDAHVEEKARFAQRDESEGGICLEEEGGGSGVDFLAGSGCGVDREDDEVGALGGRLPVPVYRSSLSNYLSNYYSDDRDGVSVSGIIPQEGEDLPRKKARGASLGVDQHGRGSEQASIVDTEEQRSSFRGFGRSKEGLESNSGFEPEASEQRSKTDENRWSDNVKDRLDKLIPVSTLLMQESQEGGVRKVKLRQVDNRERYSKLFKSEEDFASIFGKCWNDAGEELRERRRSSGNKAHELWREDGDYPDKDSQLSHVPFQSDLILVNSKRKIRTTVPFEAINNGRMTGLAHHHPNVINPMGLLKYVKDSRSKHDNLLKNVGSIIKDQVFGGYNSSEDGGVGSGAEAFLEDLSTRASTLNNLASFRVGNGIGGIHSNRVSSGGVTTTTKVVVGGVADHLSEAEKHGEKDLKELIEPSYEVMTTSRMIMDRRDLSKVSGGSGYSLELERVRKMRGSGTDDDHRGGDGRMYKSRVSEITDLDFNQVHERTKHESYTKESSSITGSSGEDLVNNRGAFEDFLVMGKKTAKLFKGGGDPNASIQKLKDTLREIDHGKVGRRNAHNTSQCESPVRGELSRTMNNQFVENFGDNNGSNNAGTGIVMGTGNRALVYDYGFNLETSRARESNNVGVMEIREFQASPDGSPSLEEKGDDSSVAGDNDYGSISSNHHLIEMSNVEEVDDSSSDLRLDQDRESLLHTSEDECYYSANTTTRYYNSLGLTLDFRQIFKSFSLVQILSNSYMSSQSDALMEILGSNSMARRQDVPNVSVCDRGGREEREGRGKRNWRETVGSYEKLQAVVDRRSLILTFVILMNVILISMANIIIPIVYNIKNALFPILSVNAIINFVIFYLINGGLIYVITRRINSFSRSILDDYLLLLQRINDIKKERRKLEFKREEDVVEHIYSQLLYEYVQVMGDLSIEDSERHRKAMWLFFMLGVAQMSFSLFLDVFAINHFNFSGVFVNIFNVVNLIISVSLNLVYLRRRSGGCWYLKDVFNRNLLLIFDEILQENQLRFLTYSSSIIEEVLFWNYISNHGESTLHGDTRSLVSNISLPEMDQQKLQRMSASRQLSSASVLCRIHLDLSAISKLSSVNTATSSRRMMSINELWPFFYLHLDQHRRKLVISRHNHHSVLYKRRERGHGASRAKSITGSHFIAVPMNFISIESIQSSVFPWILTRYSHQHPLKLVKTLTGSDVHGGGATAHDKEASFKHQTQQLISTVQNLVLLPERGSLSLNSSLLPTDAVARKHKRSPRKQHQILENKLSQIFNNYNFISLRDPRAGANQSDDSGPRALESGGEKELEDDPIYVMNCTIPAEYFLSLDVCLDDFKDLVSRDEVVRLQIACFSFDDLLGIYTLIS